MFKNYFKTAWKNLQKNKLFSIINIIGLGIAIPFALLSLIQVQSAFESDNFHPYPERTFRIITDITDNTGSKTKYALSPQIAAKQLSENYPPVEKATFVVRDFEWELNNRVKTLNVNTIYVEPSFFDIFGFKLIAGRRPEETNELVITKEKAEAFFGTADAVGKVLIHPRYGNFLVTGVLTPYKRNTHFRSDVMVSAETYKKFSQDSSLASLSGFTYVLMKPQTNQANLNQALTSLSSYVNKELAAEKSKDKMNFRAQNITAIAPDFEDLRGNAYVDSILDLSVNFGFALGLLILAAFNYINLTLARSLSRAKEVGVRKVAGALRYQLITQFICEAVLVALISLIVGYIMLKLLERFSYVNWFAWDVDNYGILWISFLLFTIIIGIVAGIIPAGVLSRFQPAKVLKGTIAPSSFGNMGLRNILVVIQFIASSTFIFLIATFFNQFKYMATDNINFNRENIFNITASNDYQLLQHDLLSNNKIERVGLASVPFGYTSSQAAIRKNTQEQNVEASYYAADADFITNMNLKFIAGNNLLQSVSDSISDFVVVNEQLISSLGLGSAKDAIGKTFLLNNEREVRIRGVLSNFCYYIYQFAARPLILQYNPPQFHVLSVKTKDQVDLAIFKSEVNAIWKKHFPHEELAFADYQKDLYDRYFPGKDMRFMSMFCIAMLIIAVLGLLGIVTYYTEKRIKEIGIRKVMGASVAALVKELSGSFLKLTIVASCLSLPIGYTCCYIFNNMFAYNPGVNLPILIILFLAIFSIALFTIIYKSIYAAMGNPVTALRSE